MLVKRRKIPRKHSRSSNEAYVEDPEDAAEVIGALLYKTTTHEDYFTRRAKLLISFGYSSWGISATLPAIPVIGLTLGFHV
ncbi:hypothetical protein C5167_036430 [Papaver somniferum]|uniref:Uncharacterized protein n=1 Tax=Papaver somniferum TaxID=3469 RepID=A0A4Y7I6M0_PAPSO|nr:hypothetical protein C5167_036430 [Papaver somniferum]